MKLLLFFFFVTVATAALIEYRISDPVARTLRLTRAIRLPTLTARMGLNFDECSVQAPCRGTRICLPANFEGGTRQFNVPPCPANVQCQCAPTQSPNCETSADCDEGESCVTAPDFEGNLCMSNVIIDGSPPDLQITVVDPTGPPSTTAPPTTTGTGLGTGTGPSTTEPPTTEPPTTEPPTTEPPTTEPPTTEPPTTEPPTTEPPTTTTATTTTTTGTATGTGGVSVGPVDDDEVCFPGSAVVHLSNGKTVRMDELHAGHEVQHDTLGTSSKIFLFTHRTKEYSGWFYRLTTESGHEVTMTGNHYIYVNGRLTAADTVRRGDTLRTLNGDSAVIRIRRVWEHGLYAPHSLHGDLVVDGVLVSGYSRAVSPALAHALLAPVRWFVSRTGVDEPLGGLFYAGGRGIEKFVAQGADRY